MQYMQGINPVKALASAKRGAMAHMKFTPEGSRAIWFSKNRRGGEMNKLHFSLDQNNHVGWLFTEPMNMGI